MTLDRARLIFLLKSYHNLLLCYRSTGARRVNFFRHARRRFWRWLRALHLAQVYAIESNPEVAALARKAVAAARDVKPGTVEIIEGLSTAITLPEKVLRTIYFIGAEITYYILTLIWLALWAASFHIFNWVNTQSNE